ncbi:MAG: hypothetical protein KAY32_16025 [Candidatus Eisenbacteria sp.]|nr:hypothetical protein [Candidatus Eisenbacteria bacterium]
MVAEQPFFDLATVVQLSDESRATVQQQLYRWIRADKLIHLRRGMYALARRYSRAPVNPAELANHLYRPSYLSREWALGFHGLIPEMVVVYTSVTPRVPRRFENALGHFEYRHIKQDAFFGYSGVEIQGRKVMLADPEKALLDFWHLSKGPWTMERMSEMRPQNYEGLDQERLGRYAMRYGSPRLVRAMTMWRELAEFEQEGTVEP